MKNNDQDLSFNFVLAKIEHILVIIRLNHALWVNISYRYLSL